MVAPKGASVPVFQVILDHICVLLACLCNSIDAAYTGGQTGKRKTRRSKPRKSRTFLITGVRGAFYKKPPSPPPQKHRL
ncbi:hypothetical protein RCIA140 [Methanocella arvoryzae MRE50]|uniref:Uncharacterized protein n=1 Tax=Methanocella arvoryzae (strain DSM 22066 / NBRC 105507 / MRE50) TaxID=351160 RepID=Q0W3N8_METAR|nr:hypothetical protein RCIA140 [Methanocella arvoryzae MRE50]